MVICRCWHVYKGTISEPAVQMRTVCARKSWKWCTVFMDSWEESKSLLWVMYEEVFTRNATQTLSAHPWYDEVPARLPSNYPVEPLGLLLRWNVGWVERPVNDIVHSCMVKMPWSPPCRRLSMQVPTNHALQLSQFGRHDMQPASTWVEYFNQQLFPWEVSHYPVGTSYNFAINICTWNMD